MCERTGGRVPGHRLSYRVAVRDFNRVGSVETCSPDRVHGRTEVCLGIFWRRTLGPRGQQKAEGSEDGVRQVGASLFLGTGWF